MGAVHQAAVLIAELAGGEPPLLAPMLGIGHADKQAAVGGDLLAHAGKHAPGVAQML